MACAHIGHRQPLNIHSGRPGRPNRAASDARFFDLGQFRPAQGPLDFRSFGDRLPRGASSVHPGDPRMSALGPEIWRFRADRAACTISFERGRDRRVCRRKIRRSRGQWPLTCGIWAGRHHGIRAPRTPPRATSLPASTVDGHPARNGGSCGLPQAASGARSFDLGDFGPPRAC